MKDTPWQCVNHSCKHSLGLVGEEFLTLRLKYKDGFIHVTHLKDGEGKITDFTIRQWCHKCAREFLFKLSELLEDKLPAYTANVEGGDIRLRCPGDGMPMMLVDKETLAEVRIKHKDSYYVIRYNWTFENGHLTQIENFSIMTLCVQCATENILTTYKSREEVKQK